MTRRRVVCVLCLLLLAGSITMTAHDFGSPQITWNREISRIVYDRCASCHRAGGTAFSLMTYRDAQPYANAIKDAVLARRMPPWGAVKGFGDFRNDEGLTQEQVELVTGWVEGGIQKGNNLNLLPKPPAFESPMPFASPRDAVRISGTVTLQKAMTLDGVLPETARDGTQIVAELPDGGVKPLLWLYEYKDNYKHPFLLRKPLHLPAGTIIRGVQPTAVVMLLPAPEGYTLMRALLIWGVLLALTGAGAVACVKGGQPASLKELHRAHVGTLDIVLLSNADTLQKGKGSFVVEFRGPGGELVDVGTVSVKATMTMPGMAPMFGENTVAKTATTGRYDVASDLSMAGSWRFTIEWNGPAGQGSTSMTGTVL